MDHDTVRDHIDQALERIAPDLDVANLRPDRDLVASADLDSMDFLNLMTAIEADLKSRSPSGTTARSGHWTPWSAMSRIVPPSATTDRATPTPGRANRPFVDEGEDEPLVDCESRSGFAEVDSLGRRRPEPLS